MPNTGTDLLQKSRNERSLGQKGRFSRYRNCQLPPPALHRAQRHPRHPRAQSHEVNPQHTKCRYAAANASIRATLSTIGLSICPEDSIPKKVDHRKIAFGVAVMNEVKFLFALEPRKALKSRSRCVIFLIKIDMCVKRRRACDGRHDEKINGHEQIRTRGSQKNRDEEIGCRITFVTEVRLRDKVGVRIMRVMEVDVIPKNPTAYRVVGDLVMYQRLAQRHEQVCAYRNET